MAWRAAAPTLAPTLAWATAAMLCWQGLALGAPAAPEDVVANWRKVAPHPLIGKAVIVRNRRITTITIPASDDRPGSALVRAMGLKDAKFILLGEVHDNPEHHKLRAGIIDALTEQGLFGRNTHPPVVSEHIRAEQAPALAEFRKRVAAADEPLQPQVLFGLLEWDKSGWPPSALFQPLYAAIIEARLKLVPAEPPRDRLRAIARGGETALEAAERAALKLDQPLPKPLAVALAGELKTGHCGMLPDNAITGMALAQRYRDASYAAAMIAEEQIIGSVILLAGNGHVRTDRGVAWYLRQHAPRKTVAGVVLVEVEAGRNDPADYVPRDPDGHPAADVVIFTPRTARPDPCEKMRDHMQKKKN